MNARDELTELIDRTLNEIPAATLSDRGLQHLADAILECFAVVQLPEPDSKGDFLPEIRLFTDDNGTDIFYVSHPIQTSSEARDTAAKLLAAANLADKIDGKS